MEKPFGVSAKNITINPAQNLSNIGGSISARDFLMRAGMEVSLVATGFFKSEISNLTPDLGFLSLALKI